MEKTLNIKGTGTYKVSPTITKISIKFDDVLLTYKEALNLSVRDANEIKKAFTDLGFNENDLKITQFDIRTKYKNEYDKNGSRIEVLVGYQYNQQFIIRFKKDNKLLSKILTKLSNCISNPKFSISYEVEDREEAESEALKLAVKDAKNRASVIALASDVTLDGIKYISDTNINNDYEFRMYDCCEDINCCKAVYNENDFDLDFNPDDLIITKTINIIWNIK